MQSIKDLVTQKAPLSSIQKEKSGATQGKKIEHEYQAVGIEMEEYFGKKNKGAIWPLFHRYPLPAIKRAFHKTQKDGHRIIRYLIADIKNS